MISSAWGAFWCIVMLVLAFWRGVECNKSYRDDESTVSFLIIAMVCAVQLCLWLYKQGTMP